MDKKNKKYVIIICVGVLAAVTAVAVAVMFGIRGNRSANLARMKGVIATCDSTENEELSADKAIDGNAEDRSSRWSSENDPGNASHYIELEFPEEISVSFVVLKWERRNVISYALEGSLDGQAWETLESFDTEPETKNQEIALDETARVRFLRLSTYAVADREEDFSNIYQNVSLYEFEVYADKPAAYLLGEASVGYNEDGSRYLVVPQAPEGYEIAYLGADYEQIIAADGKIYDTIQDKKVTVGFRLTGIGNPADTQEISRTLIVPACDEIGDDSSKEVRVAEEQELHHNDCPDVIPALAEWRGQEGIYETGSSFRVIVEEGSGLQEVAELFADRYRTMMRCTVEVMSGSLEDAKSGDVYLGYAEESEGLGEEGYTCDISDICVIKAETNVGVRWGTVTFLQIYERDCSLPKGRIRDYPLYQVRGFGIDVARKAVSMDMLYAIMEKMSFYKMNDLSIHLNDNVILSSGGTADSVEQAMTADSAFRLESDIANDSGVRLTSEEYAYTKQEFAELIETARTYGVNVVPEIDTPAHSLSITKLYPEYALTVSPESVDQIDLDQKDAVELVKKVWQEALAEEDAALKGAKIVNIGMDEYYGDGEQYRLYAKEIIELARGEDKIVRMWGSLSNMGGKTMPDPEGIQMNIWSTIWADPRQMYEAGYALINMQNNHLYVIPGGGYDYLNAGELYNNWAPNKFYDYDTMEIIPAYSAQMLGAAYMIWNDMSGSLDVGISEYDLYERFEQPLAVLSSKLWGMESEKSGEESYEDLSERAEKVDWREFGIEGEENRIYDEAVGIEPSYEVQMRVYLEEKADAQTTDTESTANAQTTGTGSTVNAQTTDIESTANAQTTGTGSTADAQTADAKAVQPEPTQQTAAQIISESDSAYGVWAFYAVEPESGQVGFAREGRTYTWDYVMPRGQWVELRIIGEVGQTTLYADGKLVGTLGNTEAFEEYATLIFPTQRIGTETGQLQGEVEVKRLR